MYQDFSSPASATPTAQRVAALREVLAKQGAQGFLIPRTNAFQGEYIPPSDARLHWISGFDGSAGLAIVLAHHAALFVDGRYTLQAKRQVNSRTFAIQTLTQQSVDAWLAKHLRPQGCLLYDAWLHTPQQVEAFASVAKKHGVVLKACTKNPLDSLWSTRPPAPSAQAYPHTLRYAGERSLAKRVRLAKALKSGGYDMVFLGTPESVAWLLNMRGGDVPHTPVALSFAMLDKNGAAHLFIDTAKVTPALARHLSDGTAKVHIKPFKSLPNFLATVGSKKRRVMCDFSSTAFWVVRYLRRKGAKVLHGQDPCLVGRAVKNPVEMRGARAAHVRDGVALTRFLAWFDTVATKGVTAKGQLSEITAAQKLESFRGDSGHLKDLSFDTISAAGSHGAIIHYRVTKATNKKITKGMVYLVDSGGQYLDGTTDVTRTIAVGRVSKTIREHYTRVLQGHIALARAVFPANTSGQQLDSLARAPLWAAGMDFAHGTGHGVGSYLSVHETPPAISKKGTHCPLRVGMLLSNEPGYYVQGSYGIRIESLMLVVPHDSTTTRDPSMLCFETVTLAPMDFKLLEPSLLSVCEKKWLNAYHARVYKTLAPKVDTTTRRWLTRATRPV